MILLWFTLFQLASAIDISVNTKNSYGPYKAKYVQYELCEQQASRAMSKNEIRLNEEMLLINMSVTDPCIMSKSKSRITVNSINESENKTLLRYNIKDPCQHFAMAPMLKEVFHMKKMCKIEKGIYPMILNLTEIFSVFFGSNFFYGQYAFKSVIWCTAGTLFCVQSIIEILKLNT